LTESDLILTKKFFSDLYFAAEFKLIGFILAYLLGYLPLKQTAFDLDDLTPIFAKSTSSEG
jgi:hypothetical protein